MSTTTVSTPAARSTTVPPADRTTRPSPTRPPCAAVPEVFQHPLLEEPPSAPRRSAEQRRHAALVAAAARACQGCPLVTACLYRAVTEHDVAGYVAGTTARQRLEIRRRLGVQVPPEDLDTLAGVVGGGHVDHDQVVRLRAAHPDESLEVLARRLGCSLSTVKRHLRQERTAPAAPYVTPRKPRLREVLAVTAEVTQHGRTGVRAA